MKEKLNFVLKQSIIRCHIQKPFYANIAKTTIFCRLKGINGAAGVGRPRAISQVTETLIAELVQFMSDIGFSLKRSFLFKLKPISLINCTSFNCSRKPFEGI